MHVTKTLPDTPVSNHEQNGSMAAEGEAIVLTRFRTRLDRALDELGRIDYGLQIAIDDLVSDLGQNAELSVRGQIAELAEPALQTTVLTLAETIRNARALTLAATGLDEPEQEYQA